MLCELVIRLLLATAAGLLVALIWRRTRRGDATAATTFDSTLVLLTVLIALTTVVIHDSPARAFGLVGALSIVRFRTVVEDTRDTAFVIFAVAAGMALGAGEYLACLVGVPIVSLVGWGLAVRGSRARRAAAPETCRLLVRVALGRDPAQVVGGSLSAHASESHLVGITTARQGAAVEARWVVKLRAPEAALALVQELVKQDGVQHVDLEDL